MKVLHVIPAVAARYGGPSRAILDMCRALEDRGIESLIVTTDADGPGRLPVNRGRPVAFEGVPVIFFSRQWSEPLKYSRPLASWLEANVARFDLVHIDAIFSHSSLAAARACRRTGVPYVVRPLGSLATWSRNRKRIRKQLLWRLGVKQMLQEAAAIQYTTSEERRHAESALKLGRGVVVPLGITEALLNRQMASDEFSRYCPALGEHPYVLVLSRLHPVKGLELFLNVFLDVTRRVEFQRWRLVVAGDGEAEYVASLKRLANDRKGDERVLFAGWLDGAKKAAALQGAALLAMPSHHENFGLSVVEALACGVPVLVSAQVNLAEEIKAAGAGWVASREHRALSEALMEALGQEAERRARGRAGRELVRSRFTWTAVAAQLEQFYRSIAKSTYHHPV
jgi:glycosyltransferase involved in cell wall biosynthesis